MSTRRALLLIADIGGYTQYMQFHRSILGHAEAATRRMLDRVVDAASGFDLVEIEGDAAFLSRDAEGLDGPATFTTLTRAAAAMHRAFHAERRLVQLNMCPCGSCTQTADLKLKFVAHVGEVATQTIRRRRKLEGIGPVHTFFLDVDQIAAPLGALPDPSWPRRIGGTLGMVGRGLPHVLPLRRARTLAAAG